jgi:hypothetical protein
MMQLSYGRLLVASLGQRPPAIGRARDTLHTLYTARGMAGYCTRMAFEGVLEEWRVRVYVCHDISTLFPERDSGYCRPVPQLF